MEDDYIIKALAIRQMDDSAAGNLESLRHLHTAESLDLLPNTNVFKQQGITYLRLDMRDEALESNAYVNSEISWTRAMIHKLDVLE